MRPVRVSQRLRRPSSFPNMTRWPHAAIDVATVSGAPPSMPHTGLLGNVSVTCMGATLGNVRHSLAGHSDGISDINRVK